MFDTQAIDNAVGAMSPGPTTSSGSVPDTWVTIYSGDIGNTFVPPIRDMRIDTPLI